MNLFHLLNSSNHRNPLKNSRGISVLFLIAAMLTMVGIGYILSYLIPAKQKSLIFPILSTQSYYLAQSGVEFAVRFASDQGWTTPAQLNNLNGIDRNLGSGKFTLTYDPLTDRLTSRGEVQNLGQRQIIVSNFTQFVRSGSLIIDPDRPPPCQSTSMVGKHTVTMVNFYIKNISSSSISLTAFQAVWNQSPPNGHIGSISLAGIQKYSGNYSSGSGQRSFDPPPYPIHSGQSISVSIVFTRIINNLQRLEITFYDSMGKEYLISLDPEGDGFQSC